MPVSPYLYTPPTYAPYGWSFLPVPTVIDSPAFHRIAVDWLIRSEARVSWELDCRRLGPAPHLFQLQRGETGVSVADDWEDIGAPLADVTYLIDPSPEYGGKVSPWHYRVVVTSADGTVAISPPAHPYGVLSRRDWRLAREIARKELLRLSRYAGAPGWLLKRRWRGEEPSAETAEDLIIDPLTGEILQPDQETTYSTGISGGFYTPYQTFFELSPESHYEHRDDAVVRGNIDTHIIRARTLAFPQLRHGDVFVHDGSDRRYMIHSVRSVAELRGVPVVVACELRLIPYDDPIYAFPVPGGVGTVSSS